MDSQQAKDLHRLKPEDIPGPRTNKRKWTQSPAPSQKLFSAWERKGIFLSGVSLSISTTLQGGPYAYE